MIDRYRVCGSALFLLVTGVSVSSSCTNIAKQQMRVQLMPVTDPALGSVK